jgi:hypothetical protein
MMMISTVDSFYTWYNYSFIVEYYSRMFTSARIYRIKRRVRHDHRNSCTCQNDRSLIIETRSILSRCSNREQQVFSNAASCLNINHCRLRSGKVDDWNYHSCTSALNMCKSNSSVISLCDRHRSIAFYRRHIVYTWTFVIYCSMSMNCSFAFIWMSTFLFVIDLKR